MLFHTAVAAGLFCLTRAVASPNALFDNIDHLPRGWSHSRNAKPDEVARFTVSLRQSNLEQLEQMVMEISDPSHSSYGQHLPKHELASLVQPSDVTVATVREWLDASNVTSYYDEVTHCMTFWTTVDNADAIFDTNFEWYTNHDRTDHKLRTTRYSVPGHVAPHVNFVEPTIKFPSLQPFGSSIHTVKRTKESTPLTVLAGLGASAAGVDPLCDYEITPTCLLQLYNIYYTADGKNGNKAAFASFLQQYARPADLKKFLKNDAKWAKGTTTPTTSFNNAKQKAKQDSTEANLDNQYLLGLAYPVPVSQFTTGGCGPLVPDPNEPAGSCDNEPYLEFLNGVAALSDADLPHVISISYGEDEQTWPYAQAVQVCNLFMQLGARGVTVLVASGDYGPGEICQNNAGTTNQFLPAFPASCPWVTVVGGTQYTAPEQAVDFSGGGFSNYFGRPSWQDTSVAPYISAQPAKFSKYFNASGRGYPDVAAQGVAFDVYDKGDEVSVYGTSCSTPTFAAVVSLLNSALVSAGKPTLGFLNPFLYGTIAPGGALNDITTGSSTGCSGEIDNAGWAAAAGWDAVTGLGTPDFGKMLKLTVPQACNTKGVLGANPSSTSCSGAAATGN